MANLEHINDDDNVYVVRHDEIREYLNHDPTKCLHGASSIDECPTCLYSLLSVALGEIKSLNDAVKSAENRLSRARRALSKHQ